jgi:hypothetical protein
MIKESENISGESIYIENLISFVDSNELSFDILESLIEIVDGYEYHEFYFRGKWIINYCPICEGEKESTFTEVPGHLENCPVEKLMKTLQRKLENEKK